MRALVTHCDFILAGLKHRIIGKDDAKPVVERLAVLVDVPADIERWQTLAGLAQFGIEELRRLRFCGLGIGDIWGRSRRSAAGNFHRLLQRSLQLVGIVGAEEFAAGVSGNALQGFRFLVGDVKTDHVNIRPGIGYFPFKCNRAGVRVAGFQPVADQNERVFRSWKLDHIVQEQLGLGCQQGQGDWRFPAWLDGLNLAYERLPVRLAGKRDGFDILAVALAAMAIDHQASRHALIPIRDEVGHHVLGNGDLGRAIDLSPHGIGAIKHEYDIVLWLGMGTGAKTKQEKGNRIQWNDGRRESGTLPAKIHGNPCLSALCRLVFAYEIKHRVMTVENAQLAFFGIQAIFSGNFQSFQLCWYPFSRS